MHKFLETEAGRMAAADYLQRLSRRGTMNVVMALFETPTRVKNLYGLFGDSAKPYRRPRMKHWLEICHEAGFVNFPSFSLRRHVYICDENAPWIILEAIDMVRRKAQKDLFLCDEYDRHLDGDVELKTTQRF